MHKRGTRRIEAWALIDEQLCGLVDRLRPTGPHHILEAELRISGVGGDPREYGFARVLPGFREKGAVISVDGFCGNRALHSSTHNRWS